MLASAPPRRRQLRHPSGALATDALGRLRQHDGTAHSSIPPGRGPPVLRYASMMAGVSSNLGCRASVSGDHETSKRRRSSHHAIRAGAIRPSLWQAGRCAKQAPTANGRSCQHDGRLKRDRAS
jgi:hypothetical protein